MAKLTSTIESVDSGKRIIGPAQTNSFIGGLAEAAGGMLKSYAVGSEKARINEAREVGNTFALGIQKIRSNAEDEFRNGPSTTDYSGPTAGGSAGGEILPPDASRSLEELGKTQKAVNQGRTTQEALDLKLERFVSDTMAKNPENAEYIFDKAKSLGLDHYMFRKGEAQSTLMDAEVQGAAQGRAEAIKTAVSNGITGDAEFLYKKGSEIERLSTEAAQAKAMREEARAASAEGREDAKWKQSRAADSSFNYYRQKTTSDIGTIVDQVNQLLLTAGDSTENFTKVQEIAGLAQQYGTSYINHITADMARNQVDPDTQTKVIEEARHQVTAIQNIVSGPSSRLPQTMKSLQYFQQRLGLESSQGLPYYSWLKSVYGSQAAIDGVFGPAGLQLSNDLVTKVGAEIKNFDPTKPNTGFAILEKLGKLVAGNASLATMPEHEITGDVVKGLRNAMTASSQAYLDPEPDDPGEIKSLLGSHGNLVLASNAIQPGYKDVKGWGFAVETLTSELTRSAMSGLIRLEGPFQEQAKTNFQAGRSSVGRLLEIGRTVTVPPAGQGLKVQNGQFVAFNNNRKMSTGGYGQSEMPIFDGTGARGTGAPSPELVLQAEMMNRAVNYLVSTAGADPELKAVPAAELRQAYLNGTKIKAKEDAKAPKATPDWNSSYEAIKNELTSGINGLPTNNMAKGLETPPVSFKNDRDALARTIIGEAGQEDHTGKVSVGAVILNRAKQSGKSISEVVLANSKTKNGKTVWQFEPWGSRAAELASIDENSPEYKAALQAADDALAGNDPTQGSDHFYAPSIMAKRGGKPQWDNGTGRDIGNHHFLKLGYKG